MMKTFIILFLTLAVYTNPTAFAQVAEQSKDAKPAGEDATFKQSESKLLEESVTFAAKYRDIKLGIKEQEDLIAGYKKKKEAHEKRIQQVKDAQKDLDNSNKQFRGKKQKEFKADNSGLDAQGQAVISKAEADIAELDAKTKEAETKIAELKKDEVSEKAFDNKFENFREVSAKVTSNEKKRVAYANLVKDENAPKVKDPEPNKDLKEVLATNSSSVIKNPPKAVKERSEKNAKEAGAGSEVQASAAKSSAQSAQGAQSTQGAAASVSTGAAAGSTGDAPGTPGVNQVGTAATNSSSVTSTVGSASQPVTATTNAANTTSPVSTANAGPDSSVEALIVKPGSGDPCRDEALAEIAKIANKDGVAFAKLFKISSLKMAYRLANTNRSTYESLVRAELAKGIPANADAQVQALYQKFGKKEDLAKLSYYRSKDPAVELTRLNNVDASAFLLHLTQGKKAESVMDLTEKDAATVWAIEKVRAFKAVSDPSFKIGERNGNLLNFSTSVYLARNIEKLSPAQMEAQVKGNIKDLEKRFNQAFATLDTRLKNCIGGACVTTGVLSAKDRNDVAGMIRKLTVDSHAAKAASAPAVAAPAVSVTAPAPAAPAVVAQPPANAQPPESARQPAANDDAPAAPGSATQTIGE